MQIDIWGAGPLAEASRVAAASLGWDVTRESSGVESKRDIIAVAPLAHTLVECDALIERPTNARRAFAWPTVSITAVQQMVGRCRSLGSLTNLSSRTTRPAAGRTDDLGAALLAAAHDQVALLVLLAQITGAGSPTSVSLQSSTDGTERIDIRLSGVTARVEVTWTDASAPSLDVQAAGVDGVLRIETDPLTRLEYNGVPVPLPRSTPMDPQLQPLRDAGVIDMLKTIGASFTEDRPLPHAFSFEFGRSIVEIIDAAVRSAAVNGAPVALTRPRV